MQPACRSRPRLHNGGGDSVPSCPQAVKLRTREAMRITSIAAGIAAGAMLAVAALPATAADQPDFKTAAKVLFSRPKLPSDQPPHPVGFYAKGCLAGGVQLPINGPDWQVMPLARTRDWRLPRPANPYHNYAAAPHRQHACPGPLLGQISQPRGGP